MEFKRTLTENEVKMLGDKPQQKLHKIIDDAFKRMSNVHDSGSVEARIISLMTTVTSMNARAIMEAHNAVFGNDKITLSYTRFIINGMHTSGLLKRVARGEYVKFDRDEEIERINKHITQIEMTGKITGREGIEYNDLKKQLSELTT